MEKAETNLQTAQTIHDQNRSKMCWIIALLIIVGIIVVLWALGVF